METVKEIAARLEDGDAERVLGLTRRALSEETPPKTILDDGLIAGMQVVGDKFKRHEIFLPDVLMAAKAMYAGMDELKPLLAEGGASGLGKVVIGSVRGDLHDIGKNLVAIMLKGAGFEVIDLGHDVSPERFVEAAEKEGAAVVGMSALLTTTMANMKETVDLLKSKGLSDEIATIVGGAPVSGDFAREIGATAYAFDASSAVDRVKELVRAKGA